VTTLEALLIENDSFVDVDCINQNQSTPLIVASSHGQDSIVRSLIEHKANVNFVGPKGWTPLHYAAFNGHFQICQAGAEVGVTNDKGRSPGQDFHKTVSASLRTQIRGLVWSETKDEDSEPDNYFEKEPFLSRPT